MATVSRENLGTLHEKISVKLEQQDYLPSFDKTLKEYAKKASIPGFRKGMVPTGMVRKMYGQAVFTDEIVRTAGKKLEDYLQEVKLPIFAQPMILPGSEMKFDFNNPSEYVFNFEIGIKPEFEITPVKNKAHLTRYKISITDKMIEDEVERIRKQYGTEDPKETVSEDEQIIHTTFHACSADGVIANEEDKTENTSILNKLPAKLKDQLMGKKLNDTLVICPAELCSAEELKNFMQLVLKADENAANNHYLLTLTKIGKIIPIDLGKELYDQVYKDGNVNDESEFRNRLKAELEREYSRITTDRLHNEMFELLVHNTPIDLPTPFLKRYMREGGDKPKAENEVEAEYPSFEHQLRWQLISDKLITEFGVTVTRDEVVNNIMTDVLAYFGVTNLEDAPWLESYKAKITKDEKTMSETFNRLLSVKLFNALEGVLTLEEKEIEEEAFFKLGDAHAAHHHHH